MFSSTVPTVAYAKVNDDMQLIAACPIAQLYLVYKRASPSFSGVRDPLVTLLPPIFVHLHSLPGCPLPAWLTTMMILHKM